MSHRALSTRLQKAERQRAGALVVVPCLTGETDEQAWARARPGKPIPDTALVVFIQKFGGDHGGQ